MDTLKKDKTQEEKIEKIAKERVKLMEVSNLFITKEDIEKAEKEIGVPNYGPLGSIVDTRTYLRWLPEERRRETFFERNARVVNYNVSLAVGLGLSMESLQEEAYLMFDKLNQCLSATSGRTMWVGGTQASEDRPASNFNCSYLGINRLGAFTTLAELLMLGVGVGLRVFPEDIELLPKISGG